MNYKSEQQNSQLNNGKASTIRILIYTLLGLNILSFIVGVMFAYHQLNKNIAIIEQSRIEAAINGLEYQTKKSSHCPMNKSLSKDELHPKYIVQPHDTLLSISKQQLGSTDQLPTLLLLNEEKYPQISIDQPFIEVGWELYLPNQSIDPEAKIIALAGEIESSDIYGNYRLVYHNSSANFKPEAMIIQPETPITIGDCMVLVRAKYSTDRDNQPYQPHSIYYQDHFIDNLLILQ